MTTWHQCMSVIDRGRGPASHGDEKGALSSCRHEKSSFLFKLRRLRSDRVLEQLLVWRRCLQWRVQMNRGGTGALSSCRCLEAPSTSRLKRQSGACVFSQLEVARSGKFWTLAVVPHAGQIAWTERARAVVRALGVAEIRSYCAIARTDSPP